MNKHVPAEVSYKAARALAYLMTRKWWKELKETYYRLSDNVYVDEGLSIEDWILANANEDLLRHIIPWIETETSISTWAKRTKEFQKIWNNNFNSPEDTAEKKIDEPLFKVGDKVRIKKRTEGEDKYWGCFVDEMAELAGKICTVVNVEKIKRSSNLGCLPDDGYLYNLEGFDSDNWFWASSMLEKV